MQNLTKKEKDFIIFLVTTISGEGGRMDLVSLKYVYLRKYNNDFELELLFESLMSDETYFRRLGQAYIEITAEGQRIAENGGFEDKTVRSYPLVDYDLFPIREDCRISKKKICKDKIVTACKVIGGVIDEVPLGTINAYMQLNNYTLATLADGSVAWAIWRKPLDPEG